MKNVNPKATYSSCYLFPLSVCIVISMAICFDSSAQFSIAMGPKVGATVTTFRGSDTEDVDKMASWLGGIFLNAQIAPSISLQPELLLTRRGGNFTHNNARLDLSINYVEIPVLAKLRLPIADVFFPHILLGPGFSFKTNVNYSGIDIVTGTSVTTHDSNIRKSDISAFVGAGVDAQTKNSGFFFTMDGKYALGFNSVYSSDQSVGIKNTGWSFSVGVGFLFKGAVTDVD